MVLFFRLLHDSPFEISCVLNFHIRMYNYYTFVPTLAELNFAEGLSVSQAQSCLYEEETREQSDTQKWHDLRAQRLSLSKFKDVCARRADFESLAARQLKKTVQTAAMRHGINTEEEAASAYADSGDSSQTALSSEPSSAFAIPQDLKDFSIKS